MRVLAPLTLLAGAVTIIGAVQGPSNRTKDPWTWGPAPAVFPAGARMAVLQGDPSQSAPFTVRLEMPDGYRIAPHFHPTDENITVIEGTFLVGMGDKLDPAKTMTLPRGGFATAQANMHHYAIARGRTVVQVHAIGPFQLTYVNPADAPQAGQDGGKPGRR